MALYTISTILVFLEKLMPKLNFFSYSHRPWILYTKTKNKLSSFSHTINREVKTMLPTIELYSLLSTSRIGVEFFADLLKKSEYDNQRDRIFTAFEMCKHHTQAVQHHLELFEIEEIIDVKSTMLSLIEKIKNWTIDSRYEIDVACSQFLQEAMSRMELLQELEDLPSTTITLFNKIHHDYIQCHQLFQECLN